MYVITPSGSCEHLHIALVAKLEGQYRLSAAILVDTQRRNSVAAGPGGDIDKRLVAVVVAVKPAHCQFGMGKPRIVRALFVRRSASIDGRPGFQRLLVERQEIVLLAKTFRPDGPEHLLLAGLLPVDPAQCIDAGIEPIAAPVKSACADQPFGKPRVVVSQHRFEPGPVGA